jgi:hypothetical protein
MVNKPIWCHCWSFDFKSGTNEEIECPLRHLDWLVLHCVYSGLSQGYATLRLVVNKELKPMSAEPVSPRYYHQFG